MMAITHGAIAAAGTSLILGSADPFILGLAIVGSQLPDLDTSTSTIGQILFPISSWIEDRFPHRSITHSLAATALLAALSFGACHYFGQPWQIALALPLGHLLSCFSDCFTKQGVQLFWPCKAWCISVSNPHRRLTTGGPGEYWVLVLAGFLLAAGIHIAGGGGIQAQVTQGLGLRDGAIATYNQNAATHQIWANIEGVYASDRTDASGKYFILDTAGNEFIVLDRTGRIFQTNQQIIATKVTTDVGQTAQTQLQTLTFDDENPLPKLEEVRASYPDAIVFVTGNVTVDFPEDIEIPPQTGYSTVGLSGSTLKLSYEGIEKAIELLADQYAIGSLSVKIIKPAPVWN
ncbi:metal-dependent hydrolase [Oscillatoriales cyanobacterium LEGE 11467]|uniref:Metal-dependent hydrolase n=1 Tax=Zarconia navalis LEGE 11467 TaxID=1828826 RepID=A0A928VXQ8_9CYAN|nr:metal-dependent hydrolase [Zarconia navalis]MBE9040697.1 metal-dependent hydrolase [Zarconia navalis LEGE 11467]